MRYEKLKKIAMDLEEVYMTTNLGGEATFFLPFNMWQGYLLILVSESLS